MISFEVIAVKFLVGAYMVDTYATASLFALATYLAFSTVALKGEFSLRRPVGATVRPPRKAAYPIRISAPALEDRLRFSIAFSAAIFRWIFLGGLRSMDDVGVTANTTHQFHYICGRTIWPTLFRAELAAAFSRAKPARTRWEGFKWGIAPLANTALGTRGGSPVMGHSVVSFAKSQKSNGLSDGETFRFSGATLDGPLQIIPYMRGAF